MTIFDPAKLTDIQLLKLATTSPDPAIAAACMDELRARSSKEIDRANH